MPACLLSFLTAPLSGCPISSFFLSFFLFVFVDLPAKQLTSFAERKEGHMHPMHEIINTGTQSGHMHARSHQAHTRESNMNKGSDAKGKERKGKEGKIPSSFPLPAPLLSVRHARRRFSNAFLASIDTSFLPSFHAAVSSPSSLTLPPPFCTSFHHSLLVCLTSSRGSERKEEFSFLSLPLSLSLSSVVCHVPALAHKVLLSVRIVHTTHGGPELAALPHPRSREGRLIAGVGSVPVLRHHVLLCVGCSLQRVVVLGPFSLLDLPDFLTNQNHRIAETVELSLVLGLSRLDHQSARHGPAHGGGMESEVDQTLRNVLLDDADRLELGEIQDELVSASPVLASEFDLEVGPEPLHHIVRIQDRNLGASGEALSSEHVDEHPGDRQNHRRTIRSCRDCPSSHFSVDLDDSVSGQEGSQVLPHTDRPNARAAASVGNREGLVEVQMAHVGTDQGRGGETDLCVHVGTVHVHLASVLVDGLADGPDVRVENSHRGRVRHHQRS
mmetsp:Transcript_31644/g.62603  ORF Transcript_31644/g.62603 Transcript_31644/m.62603 type:complete len:499 (-) Transcript_31644:2274-3770(-)